MATTMSSPSSPQRDQPSTNVSSPPAIITEPPTKQSGLQRTPSFAKDRLSTYSNASFASQNRSRPTSSVFPMFHSSLSYALVRDFAYPVIHPLHYGPPPPSSGVSTPASENRRLSDPPPATWDGSRGQWSAGPWTTESIYGHQQLPAMSFGDGPPYSEDEDLHSPVITARHRKHKSTQEGRRGRSPGDSGRGHGYPHDDDRGMLVSMNGDGSETYYVKDDDAADDGPGGEFVTYPASERRYSHLASGSYDNSGYGDSYYDRQGLDPDAGLDSDDDFSDTDQYSRDYQFSIASPDEEMHGKAVALFDFTREHENELPLKEGQVILVSYRHGQGWLVAEDPKTGESGLVPEEFVRLVRDIEGGLTSLNGELSATATETNSYPSPEATEPDQAETPTPNDHVTQSSDTHSSNASSSEFSTSSRDLDPLGGGQEKAIPPEVGSHDETKLENGKHVSTSSTTT
ncbi:hypothetical protein VTN02DRAFT_5260 [Thermoascus thermophilus]